MTFFQVGVIGNGTEYQHALKEDAHPKSNECMYKLRALWTKERGRYNTIVNHLVCVCVYVCVICFLVIGFVCFIFSVYNNIDDAVDALKSKEVKGMLLDLYTASYYQKRDKLKTLLAVKKLDLQRDVGVLFNENKRELAECLQNYHRSAIWRSMQTLTSFYEVPSLT